MNELEEKTMGLIQKIAILELKLGRAEHMRDYFEKQYDGLFNKMNDMDPSWLYKYMTDMRCARED